MGAFAVGIMTLFLGFPKFKPFLVGWKNITSLTTAGVLLVNFVTIELEKKQ